MQEFPCRCLLCNKVFASFFPEQINCEACMQKEREKIEQDIYNYPLIKSYDENDMINHPQHYKSGGIEAIDIIENYKMNFNLGNCLKYLVRCERKGTKKQDLKKLIWYAQREIDRIED